MVTRYSPSGGRGIGFGAALALNTALIGALFFIAPKVIPTDVFKPMDTFNVPLDPPPLPTPEPETRKVEQQARPIDEFVVPKREMNVPSDPVDLGTTDVIREGPPPTDFGSGTGITEVKPVESPVPPPFVAAIADKKISFQPPYPASEIRINGEGMVIVRVKIGVDGRVIAVERIEAASDAFFESTRRYALARWRFTPATRGGVPVESWKQLTVRFELER